MQEVCINSVVADAKAAILAHTADCHECKRSGLSHLPCEVALPLWGEYRKLLGFKENVEWQS